MSRKKRKKRHSRHRTRLKFRRSSPPGSPPGSVSPIHKTRSTLEIIAYGPRGAESLTTDSLDHVIELGQSWDVVWININGLGDLDLLKRIAEIFSIHPLTLEDILHVHQRAKFERYENYQYFVTRMVFNHGDFHSEQMSIILAGKFVITFQEREGDCLGTIRDRILSGLGSIRQRPADYLVYTLIDVVVDNYFPVVDQIGETLDKIEERLLADYDEISLMDIHQIKSQLLELRRYLRPYREMLNQLIRDSSDTMSNDVHLYLRDCYDHVIQLTDTVETYRDICSDLRDFYLSMISYHSNEVMKTLTVIATIFIPITFIVGVYGMNFDYMPELHWKFGYLGVWILMVGVAVGFLAWFRRRGWF